jgi:hypothetical protein
MRRIVSSFALASALVMPSARAFFDPPWITPAAPRAGETMSVNIRGGICDAIFFRQGYPQITRQGNAIRILEYGHHWDDLDLCVYDVGTLVQPIGNFTSGDYTLTVDFAYEGYPLGLTTVTLGVVPFSVAGAASVTEVPTSTTSGLIALVVLIGCLALRGLHLRQR